MNDRGQLSIIAALLVAVILITAVAATYSLVRDNPVHGQPQIQSALDETDLAIKQILCSAVSYYGSILRVTGNSTYAKTNATNYLQSGLAQIANIHPEWASSVSMNNLNLYAYWYASTSYSGGDLTVTYNLTGLGITGMSYTTSCELSVSIMNPSSGQARLNVTEDTNEPLADLRKQNFLFFLYQNSSWQLTPPTADPTAYANGTYQIVPPTGIDANSYLVQVQDQRGIIVVASSYSSYTMNLTWPSIALTTLYAHQETTSINGTNYYNLSANSADASGLTMNASMSSSRTPLGKTVYALQGVSTIPTSTWTMYYRAWKDPSEITYDNGGSGDTGSYYTNTFSWSHTTGSGSDRIMIVGVSIRSSSVSVGSITYGAQSLTSIRSDINSNGVSSELWYLTAPNPGTHTVTVTLSGSSRATGGSCTYTGVNQTTPIENSAGGSNYNSSPSQSITVNTANCLLLGHVAILGTSSYPYSVVAVSSEGSGQTQQWDEVTTSTNNVNTRGHGSDKSPVGTGSQSMSWTLSGSARWAVSLVAIRPATSASVGHIDVDILTRQSNGAIRNVIAAGAAASGDLTSTPTTLSGSFSSPTYNVTSQTDYLEIDYYVNVTAAGSINAHLIIDNKTLAIGDQTRVIGLNLPNLKLGAVPDTLTVELLQNGTMLWLGQSLQLTTPSEKPFPPIPTKDIHVNQTVNGVCSEVPFQIEDWASSYRVPLGLTNNVSLFNSGNMLVFLANSNVSRVTVWWNGSDMATQTPFGYTNTYFTDNPSSGVLNNGKMTLQIPGSFILTSTVGSTSCTANFMRINAQTSTYGSNTSLVITNGVVRDIIHQEAEWSNGVSGCPNVYSDIVLTLPANATYYTYQLTLVFISSQQSRSISDLCPIWFSTTSAVQTQTENGNTADGLPTVVNGTGLFYNSSSVWQHHWSQFISGTSGAGIMFTDKSNQGLYIFDSIAGSNTGALAVSATTKTIQLLPVDMSQVSFTNTMNVVWYGAVATFSGNTPIYSNSDQTGLWILVEYPPTVAVGTRN
jgi:hypothetical protein